MRFLFLATVYLFPTFVCAQEAAQESVRPRAVSVQSNMLQEVGPWGAAALPEGLTPLPSDLWRGADPGTLGLVLAKLSPDQRFPSLQSLLRQAIFSGGSAPTSDPDIARARFEAANRIGPAEASARLIYGVPRLSTQPNLAAIAIDAGLRIGRTAEACSLIEAVSAPPQGTVWLEARAACYALNDEPAAANLSVDLAKARGLTDTWLSRAVAAVAGPLTAPPPFRVDSGRAVALSLKAKLKPPVTLSANQDPMALSALVGVSDFMVSLPPEERLALVRNGAGRGVVSSALVATHQPIPDPAAASTPIPAQMTQKLLAAPSLSLRAVEARIGLADLKAIIGSQPGLLTLSDVPVLTEAALWGSDGALASSIASLAPDTLDPRLALVLALYDPSKQAHSVAGHIDAAPADPVGKRLAMRDAMVAWSAGMPAASGLSGLVQAGLPWGPAGNAGVRAALDLASSRGSKGEVILLVAMALQGIEPSTADPETLIAAVKALRRAGLPEAARDLARDYLLSTYVTLPTRTPTRARTAASAPQSSAQRAAQAAPFTPASKLQPAPNVASRPAPRPVIRAPATSAPPAPTTPAKPSWGTP
jgi:hypothetical protein